MYQEQQIVFSFVLLILLLTKTDGQCPENFRYYRNETTRELMGIVEIQTPPQGVPLHLLVVLSAAVILPTRYVGYIELAKSRDESIRAVLKGFPLFYRIHFPVKNPIPVVTSITLNDVLYCIGPPAVGEVVTQMILEHTLYPPRVEIPLTEQLLDLISHTSMTVPTSTINPNRFPKKGTTTIQPYDYESENFFKQKPDNTSCGIIDGEKLSLQEESDEILKWPWLSAIFKIGEEMKFRCTGNLITNQHVLTVAHCLVENGNRMPTDSLLVSLGRSNLLNWEEIDSINVRIEEYKLHPAFEEIKDAGSDLAVIKLARRITFTPKIRSVCLWMSRTETDRLVGGRGFIVGWSNDEKVNQLQAEPRLISVSIISQRECLDASFGLNGLVNSSKTLCAKSDNVRSPHKGNDGSGLIMFHSGYNRYHMRGVFLKSLINVSGQPNHVKYSIYVDIAKHLAWIYDEIIS